MWNPYAIGANHQQGPNLIFEPLAFFSAFANEEIMWLAEELQLQRRLHRAHHQLPEKAVSWSDGQEFDCEDVVYTLNTLKELKEQVRWGKDVDAAMDNAELVDKYTAKVNLAPPRSALLLPPHLQVRHRCLHRSSAPLRGSRLDDVW